MYCEKCKTIYEGETKCPNCKNSTLRAPQKDDICLLTECNTIWGGMLEDVLKQNNIPAMSQSNIGAGLSSRIGQLNERLKFYVPYEYLAAAGEIVEELFGQNE